MNATEVVEICRDLLRIDTTNTGDNETSAGERAAAEYVAEKLADVGLEPHVHESAPGRASVVARFAGEDPSRDALLVHGHLDVVPADASEWSVPPFAAEIKDGYLWGRGAIDMKNFDAMVLAVVRQMRREGRKPPRDLVLAFVADEEAGSTYGAQIPGRAARRILRGLYGGDRRGRRVLRQPGRRRAVLPDRDRAEGHRLAAPARARAGPGTAR